MTRDQAAGLTLGILTGALLTRWWAPRLARAIAGTPRQTHTTPPETREQDRPVPQGGFTPERPAERHMQWHPLTGTWVYECSNQSVTGALCPCPRCVTTRETT